jgi:hypothetical protein
VTEPEDLVVFVEKIGTAMSACKFDDQLRLPAANCFF